MLFGRFLEAIVKSGDLRVVDARGRDHRFGNGTPPALTIRLHRPDLHWRLFFQPDLYAGEAYCDGTFTVEGGSLYDVLALIARNADAAGRPPRQIWADRFLRLLNRLDRSNDATRSRRNASHHYDLSRQLYALFLDADWQYSCAYFRSDADDLEAAQQQKRRHIAAKLLLHPGMRVLDVGCGWGGLALYLADRFAARVTGITVADEQLAVAQARAREAGLADRTRFFLRDYRELDGSFERIVSVGMFEHVGTAHFRQYFDCLRDRLTDDGVALLHTIGHMGPPGPTNPWITRYIFPGGYVPSLSEIAKAIEESGLWITDIEVWRLHYAETLRCWRHRFLARRDEAKALYDERFCRMWEFYLALSEISFRYMRQCVYQIQLAKRRDGAPIIRDYMMNEEQALDRRESGHFRAA
ncbi:MAG: cyclopropane-fatty-acyl-phospholipid synthase family protein [Rhodospirillales bacterium]